MFKKGFIVKPLLKTAFIAAAIFPFIYIAAPIIKLMAQTSPIAFWSVFTDTQFLGALGVSFTASLITTCLTIIFGLPAAYLLSTHKLPWQPLWEAILFLPILLPPMIGGIAELNFFGPYTWLGHLFAVLPVSLINNLTGIVIAQTYMTSPLLIFSAKTGFDDVPKDLRDATRVEGGSEINFFWSIALPLAKSAVLTGVCLTFARAMGEFGATLLMAYHPYTLPVDIWVEFTGNGLSAIVPIASFVVILFIFSTAIISWLRRKLSPSHFNN